MTACPWACGCPVISPFGCRTSRRCSGAGDAGCCVSHLAFFSAGSTIFISALFPISDYRANDIKSGSKTGVPASKICQGSAIETEAHACNQFPATESERCASMGLEFLGGEVQTLVKFANLPSSHSQPLSPGERVAAGRVRDPLPTEPQFEAIQGR